MALNQRMAIYQVDDRRNKSLPRRRTPNHGDTEPNIDPFASAVAA